MINRPLFVPAGVRLVPMTSDEENAPVDRAVLVCEGRCRPSWTPHRRVDAAPLVLTAPAGVNLERATAELAAAVRDSERPLIVPAAATVTPATSTRYACEHCNTSRRWGS